MQKVFPWLLMAVMLSALLLNGCSLLQVSKKEDAPPHIEEETDAVLVEELEDAVEIDLAETEMLKKETTAAGVEYTMLEYGDGPKLMDNMRVKLHYAGYLAENRKMFDSSYERGEPLSFVLGKGMVIDGWEDALPYLRVGDKVRLWIPYFLAYGEKGRGPIPPVADLIFDMDILAAEEVGVPELFVFPVPEEGDSGEEKLDTLITESGLQIILKHEGTGELPVPGNVLSVHYSGYLSDSTLFDSSLQRGVPVRFVLGASQVIRGWDEGFALLKEGSKARMILPPWLAYGEKGAGPIPPDETIFFDVELLEVID